MAALSPMFISCRLTLLDAPGGIDEVLGRPPVPVPSGSDVVDQPLGLGAVCECRVLALQPLAVAPER